MRPVGSLVEKRPINRLAMVLLGTAAVCGPWVALAQERPILRDYPNAAPLRGALVSETAPIRLAADIDSNAAGRSSSSRSTTSTSTHDANYRRWRDGGRLPGEAGANGSNLGAGGAQGDAAAANAPRVGTYPLTPWPSLVDQLPATRVNYYVIDQPLERVLVELGTLAGITIQPTRQLNISIKAQRFEGQFNHVIDRIMQQHRLVAMREGPKITIASDAETTVRYIKASPQATPERIAAALRLAGVSNIDGRVQLDTATGLIQITMPGIIGERIESILINATAMPTTAEATGNGQASEPTMIKFGKVLK